MKIEWLVTDVTPVGSPDRTSYFMDDFSYAFLWPIQAVFDVGAPLCGVGNPS